MKKIVLLLTYLSLLVSCSQFDDSEIWEKLNDHEYRIAYLEKVCEQLNIDIVNVQSIVTALESNDYIVNASPLTDGSGYILIFKSGKSIVIYNGKDGANGKDATIPTISVAKDTDGYYYWTIDGEWLMVDGMKVRASAKDGVDGTDGKDGADGKDGVDGIDGKDGADGKDGVDGVAGKDGITPQFKIENNYWYISYDNGTSWEKLGRATGSNGLDGVDGNDGDSMFKRVYVENGYVCFELNDNANTIIRVPLMKDGVLQITLEKEGTLSNVLTSEETRTTTSLSIKGRIDLSDMQHIQIMQNLQKLDLRDVVYVYKDEGSFFVNPYKDTLINKTLEEIVLPKLESVPVDLSYCLALKKVEITSDNPIISSRKTNDYHTDMKFCPNISILEYAEGVVNVCTSTDWPTINSLETIIYPSTTVYVDYSLTVCPDAERMENRYGYKYVYTFTIPCKNLVCKATTPPIPDPKSYASKKVYNNVYHGYADTDGYRMDLINVPNDAILYVPRESIKLYKVAPLWELFTNIKAIEEM